MKKIISLLLVAAMAVSVVPMALATTDYTNGTKVEYTATGSESYTITVPAQLAPGGNGTVTLEGTWADNRIVTVTADPTVTLTNSIKAEDQKVLDVTFAGISEKGSNTTSQTFTETVSVGDITNALFGTWSGKFNYNVEIADTELNITIQNLDGSLSTYKVDKGMTWREWIQSEYNTDGYSWLGDIVEAPRDETKDFSDYLLHEGGGFVNIDEVVSTTEVYTIYNNNK